MKRVQDINGSCKSNCVNGSVSISGVVLDNLQHSTTFAFPWFGGRVFSAKLSRAQCTANSILDAFGKHEQVLMGGADPK